MYNFTSLTCLSYESRCVITGNGGTSYTYLGRPWGPFGRVVFAYTWMDACIKHVGWHNWDKPENERSACFYEYRYFMFSPSRKYLQLYNKIEINFITYIHGNDFQNLS